MKKLFAVLFVLALSVVGALGTEEQFFIPIGENFKYHVKTIQITIHGTWKYLPVIWTENIGIYKESPYNPSEGTVQEAAEKLLRQLAGQFSLPALQNTNDRFSVNVEVFPDPAMFTVANNGPGFGEEFALVQDATGRWRIPEKALTVKLEYEHPSFYLPWVKKTEKVLYAKYEGKEYDIIHEIDDFATDTDGIVNSSSKFGFVTLASYEAVPEARKEYAEKYPENPTYGWTRGELTLFGENNTFVKVDLRNGVKIAESTPPPYPVGPRAPRIARIIRYNFGWKETFFHGETELILEGEKGAQLILEFSENLTSPAWENVEFPYVLLTSNAKFITHRTSSATGFYRLRIHKSEPQKQ